MTSMFIFPEYALMSDIPAQLDHFKFVRVDWILRLLTTEEDKIGATSIVGLNSLFPSGITWFGNKSGGNTKSAWVRKSSIPKPGDIVLGIAQENVEKIFRQILGPVLINSIDTVQTGETRTINNVAWNQAPLLVGTLKLVLGTSHKVVWQEGKVVITPNQFPNSTKTGGGAIVNEVVQTDSLVEPTAETDDVQTGGVTKNTESPKAAATTEDHLPFNGQQPATTEAIARAYARAVEESKIKAVHREEVLEKLKAIAKGSYLTLADFIELAAQAHDSAHRPSEVIATIPVNVDLPLKAAALQTMESNRTGFSDEIVALTNGETLLNLERYQYDVDDRDLESMYNAMVERGWFVIYWKNGDKVIIKAAKKSDWTIHQVSKILESKISRLKASGGKVLGTIRGTKKLAIAVKAA